MFAATMLFQQAKLGRGKVAKVAHVGKVQFVHVLLVPCHVGALVCGVGARLTLVPFRRDGPSVRRSRDGFSARRRRRDGSSVRHRRDGPSIRTGGPYLLRRSDFFALHLSAIDGDGG